MMDCMVFYLHFPWFLCIVHLVKLNWVNWSNIQITHHTPCITDWRVAVDLICIQTSCRLLHCEYMTALVMATAAVKSSATMNGFASRITQSTVNEHTDCDPQKSNADGARRRYYGSSSNSRLVYLHEQNMTPFRPHHIELWLNPLTPTVALWVQL